MIDVLFGALFLFFFLPIALLLILGLVIKGFVFACALFFRIGFGALKFFLWAFLAVLLLPVFLLFAPLLVPLLVLGLFLLALPVILLFSLLGISRPC